MTLTKERRQRHAMRALRIEIFNEIDRLDKRRCKNCRGKLGSSANIEKYRCGCMAAVQIREIGKYL